MQATVYTVNKIGLEEIKNFLSEKHKLGGDHFTLEMLHAWASEAEFQLGEGNPASIEIGSRYSVSGRPEIYTISDAGLDARIVEIDE